MRISRVLSTWSIWKMAACRAIELSIPSTLAEVQMRKVSLLASCFGFVPWGRVVLASLPACRWSQRHSRTPTTRLKSHFSMQTRLRMTSWFGTRWRRYRRNIPNALRFGTLWTVRLRIGVSPRGSSTRKWSRRTSLRLQVTRSSLCVAHHLWWSLLARRTLRNLVMPRIPVWHSETNPPYQLMLFLKTSYFLA